MDDGLSLNCLGCKRLSQSLSDEDTLRDQFAMAALTGMTANTNTDESYDVIVGDAYRYADAMLAARAAGAVGAGECADQDHDKE